MQVSAGQPDILANSVPIQTNPNVPRTAGENLAEQEDARRKMPSWLVSFIFHLALLLILALVPLHEFAQGPLTLLIGQGNADGDAEFELLGPDSTETVDEISEESVFEEVTPPNELLQVDIPKLVVAEAQPDVSVTENGVGQPLINIPHGIKNGLIGRTGKLKSQLLSRFGGNSDTEDAVELGLAWLAKQQKSNGSWSLQGPYSSGGASENTTAATAMAINAFLGAGYTGESGKYRENVKLGLAYLIRRQDSDGFFSEREPSRQQMYAQAIASIAVIEAYGMSNGDPELRSAAGKAIRFAEWSQSSLSGWRYEPRVDADLSVTGWFVMAMITGKMAGLPVNEDVLQAVHKFLDSVSYEDDSRYGYSRFERTPSLSMTAEGMLCRLYLGWSRTDPALLRAVKDDFLPTKPSNADKEYSIYYWYYATQVMHHVGGRPWQEWNDAMKVVIPTMQIKNGRETGSWDPAADVFGPAGGRLYVTCLNLYCLEVYYRHLALYDVK